MSKRQQCSSFAISKSAKSLHPILQQYRPISQQIVCSKVTLKYYFRQMRPFLIRSVTDGHSKYQRPRHACSITEGCPGSSWIILEFHITSWIIISCPPKSFCIIKRSNLIIMDNFGSSWRNSDHLGSSGIILDHLDSSWIIFSHQRSHGSYRIISDHFGSS